MRVERVDFIQGPKKEDISTSQGWHKKIQTPPKLLTEREQEAFEREVGVVNVLDHEKSRSNL